MAAEPKRESTGRHAFLVASGIFLSRIFGVVRQRYFNKYFGLSDAADAFNAALKIPNVLQNLLGEGVLSASFIPVYARLLAEGDEEESGRVAGAVFAILALVTSLVVLLGVFAAPYLIDLIAAGFSEDKRKLTIQIVRVLFPGTGLLVLSAWCLGILNSHRKFLLSYTAPVLWNAVMIGTLLIFHNTDQDSLSVTLAWGSVVGSALQFLIQVPFVLRLVRKLRPNLQTHAHNVRVVGRSFGPIVVSRGVVQISGYVDAWLASWLGRGAVAGLANAQTLYMLPVSLFGMAVSAAELPAMSSVLGDELQVSTYLRQRLNAGLRQIAFFIVPSAMAFLALGDVIAAALFQSGKFTHQHSVYVWGILAGSAVGLLASTLGRLYSSTYYALRDTRTPLRFAVVRIILTTALGYVCALPLPHWLGIQPRWGVAGLTASAGIAGWVEFTLLRRTLNQRIGQTGIPRSFVARLWISAAVAAAAAWAVKLAIGHHHPILVAIPILSAYGLIYFGLSYALGVEECVTSLKRLSRLRR
ncbi:MAG TPA: murein biosynthesis integral membrane protein MurJ [Candidatus Sulfopaludibacter sp.]|nr:murein biosynthesis integral membrane protein MurJ [Candidatus Sulfopaludibacter sp.]